MAKVIKMAEEIKKILDNTGKNKDSLSRNVIPIGLLLVVAFLFGSGLAESKNVVNSTKVPTVVLSPTPTIKVERSVEEIRKDISEKLEKIKNEKLSISPSLTPAATPTVGLAEDYSSYLDKMSEILADFGEVSITFSEVLSKYPDYSFKDIAALASYSTVLEMYYDKFKAIQPPLKFKNVHSKFLNSAKLIKDAMPILRQGIDEDNYNLINQASDKIETATRIIQEATKELEKIGQ